MYLSPETFNKPSSSKVKGDKKLESTKEARQDIKTPEKNKSESWNGYLSNF